MKLSSRSEYACLALIELAQNYDKGLISTAEIAERQNIPRKFLEQILLNLRNAGYLKSKRGNEGGYTLAKNPSKISLAEIIRSIDGALAPVDSVSKHFYDPTPIEQNEKLKLMFEDIRNYIAVQLEKTTLADLV